MRLLVGLSSLVIGCGGLSVSGGGEAGFDGGGRDADVAGDRVSPDASDADASCGGVGEPCCVGSECRSSLVCRGNVCGGCVTNGDCPGGGRCQANGRCLITLASTQWFPSSIAVDGESVYWTNVAEGNQGTVMKVSLTGAAITTIAMGLSEPQGIAIGPTKVYWVNGATQMDAFCPWKRAAERSPLLLRRKTRPQWQLSTQQRCIG